MKDFLKALALAGSLAAAAASAQAVSAASAEAEASATGDGGLVARVNGEPVSQAEFQRMLGNPLTRSQLQQELGVQDPEPRQLQRLALRKAIHHRLMLEEGARRKIEVTRQELEKAIAALRRRFEDLESFGKWMKDQGLDDKALFEAIRGDMVAGRVWASLTEGVRVTEEQAQQYYESHKEELLGGEQVRLRIIAVEDKEAADEILASLREGASFARLARGRSAGLRAASGGDTGWVDARTLPEPLRKAVPLLKVGDVAGPLERGADGFLLVGLEGRRTVRAKDLADARAEIERRLLPARQQSVVTAWLTDQEKAAKIEILLPNGME